MAAATEVPPLAEPAEPFYPTPRPAGNNGDDYLTLPFVERILMEEDINDKFFYQYPDHPALLQAQEAYAKILYDSDATTTTTAPSLSSDSDIGVAADIQTPALSNDADEEEASNSKEKIDGDHHAFYSMAFLKGMEEANKLLPANKTLLLEEEEDGYGDCRGRRKNRHNYRDAETADRKSKMMAPDEPEETGEVVDEMIANGYQLFLQEVRSLRISMGGAGASDKKNKKKTAVAVDLQTLLLRCAEAVATDDRRAAAELLAQIRQHSSPRGDATQRLAHYFAQGLEARLAGSGSPAYRSIVARRTSTVDFLNAYRLYAAVCCFRMMAFKFANMTICKAVAAKKKKTNKLHVVDYGVQYGTQWPGLLRFFSSCNYPGGPPEVRLTGIDLPQPGFRPAARVEETGRRLTAYARHLGVPFSFRAIAAKWESVTAADLDLDPDGEVLVVNSVDQLGLLMDEGAVVDATDAPSPRDVVLGNVRRMRPDALVLSVANAAYGGSPYFVPRFREAVRHYAAMFDMMDATAPRDSERRVLVERELLGQRAQNAVACEGLDRVERPQTYRQWQARMLRARLRQLPLDPDVAKAVRESVRDKFHQGFVTDVDQQWLLGGWKGRILYAMSTWAAP